MTNYQKSRKDEVCRLTGYWLVLIMACLQAFYAFQAFVDPVSFASFRGTPLMKVDDADWVRIYASRTLFVALIVGFLLFLRNYMLLKWIALFGLVMPLCDALLAYQAEAASPIILKHIATTIYLFVTFLVLEIWTKSQRKTSRFRARYN